MALRWGGRWAACAAVALAGAACSADDDGDTGTPPVTQAEAGAGTTTSTTEPAVVDGLAAAVERSRVFGPQHMFELILIDHGEVARQVTAYQLDSPLFEVLEPHERDVRPWTGGVRTSMPMPYGAPRCDAADGAGGSVVVVHVDGAPLRLPVDEAPLRQQHREECAAEAVGEAVDLRFGDRWQPGERGVVTGTLQLTARRDGAVATVEGVAGTVIFTLRPHDPPERQLRVDGERPAAEVGVDVAVTGCSAHALIESKKTYRFPMWVSLDGADGVRVEVEPEGPARAALEQLLADCRADAAG